MTPYQYGRQDYFAGESENPYTTGSQDWRDWEEGYQDAHDEENGDDY